MAGVGAAGLAGVGVADGGGAGAVVGAADGGAAVVGAGAANGQPAAVAQQVLGQVLDRADAVEAANNAQLNANMIAAAKKVSALEADGREDKEQINKLEAQNRLLEG